MSQQINLLTPAFRKARVALSLAVVGKSLALTLVVLGAVQFYLHQEVDGLNQELRSAQALLQTQRAHVTRMAGDRKAALSPDAALSADIAKLEAQLAGAKQHMEALQGGAIGTQRGFSEYMRAFSRQTLNGLWLTGFKISGAGELALHGRALEADLIPAYIQRLTREEVLKGRVFSGLELRQPEARSGERVEGVRSGEARAASYLEFMLTTAEPLAAAAPRTERAP